MPSKWIGVSTKDKLVMRWSPRQENYRFDREDKSSNAGERECSMLSHSRVSTEPTKEDGPSSVQRMSTPRMSTWAS